MPKSSVPVIKPSHMLKKYLIKFCLRIAVFLSVFIPFCIDPELVDITAEVSHTPGIWLLWFFVLASVLAHLHPKTGLTVGCHKQYAEFYDPVPNYDQEQLKQTVWRMDKNALKVLIVWFVPNLSIGTLYLAGILRASVLVLLCAFYYFCDLICLLFFCPFRTLFLKNRCCVSCRAYTWGAWMMVTPMMFIPHWYSQVLFWAGTLAFICWEVRYRKYPERFWEGSNRTLQCAHCKELICQYKVPHARRFY